MTVPPGPDGVSQRLAELGAALRSRGVRCGVGELLTGHRSLAAVDPASRDEVRDALRAVLCSSHADVEAFEEAFEEVFGTVQLTVRRPARAEPQQAEPAAGAGVGDGEAESEGPEASLGQWSHMAALVQKDFAAYTEAEREMARWVMRRLARREAHRRSLRTRPTRQPSSELDLRATIRAGMRFGGELVDRRWRTAVPKPRPLVFVCDVSGSMRPYSRMLLQYLQVAVVAGRRVEAFVFSTRLTHVTRELALQDPDQALTRLIESVDDFASGTRVGAALAELNRVHGRRIGRGAVTVVLSDGWDRGDPDELAAELARLRRCSHRLVWLNPLAGDPRFEPLTRGMVAAMPHVDHLMAANSLASLEDLATLLEQL